MRKGIENVVWNALSPETRKDIGHLENRITNIRGLLTLACTKLIELDDEYGFDSNEQVQALREISKQIRTTGDCVTEMIVEFEYNLTEQGGSK